MGYFSCNSDSSIIACDPYNWKTKKKKSNRKKKKKKSQSPSSIIRTFSYSDLESATNGFSSQFFLGKGSHGSVYKAVLDQGKLVVAVKKTNGDANGDNEVEILSRIRSPRFVNLLGFSVNSNRNRLIVVEFMENGSLYDLLHSDDLCPPGWPRRVRLALQIAKAIEILHSSNPPVIHRDIKSSNVLIDKNCCARLGDFGLALRGNVEDVRVRGTPPAGTLGYIDPGYVAPENLSPKSDVFSFGILLLEIISGRNAIDLNYSPSSVVDWAVPRIKHGDFMELCDTRIDPPVDVSVIRKLGVLAARCVSSISEKRPSMEEVVECLRGVNKTVAASSSSSIWRNLTRQMRKQSTISVAEGMLDVNKEASLKSPIQGIRTLSVRNRRRVSSVQPRMDLGREQSSSIVGGKRVNRSNSIGSAYEIKVGGSDSDFLNDPLRRARMKKGVAVRMPYVKFNKSRSLGVLQSTGLVQDNQRGYVFQLVKKNPQIRGFDELKQSSCSILLNMEQFSSADEL